MLARSAYRLIVTRTGHAPARLAAPDRVDHLEIVGLDDMEVVLFWDVPGRATSRLEAEIRADLDTLEAEEFYARWAAFDPADID
ncbi:MAG TPA: hypothetical protein VMT10_09655 [Solirubrobacteraceae bacterium]|nr:hypothetical protein [Solirubrobacteraceae bacterium]